MSDTMHYHMYHNTPGYLPEGDSGTFETFGEAALALAEDLERYADSLYERVDAFKLPDERSEDEDPETARALEDEGDRLHAIARELRDAFDRETLPSSVRVEGESYPVDHLETVGLGIGTSDPEMMHDLGHNYYAVPCEDPSTCELSEDLDY